MLAGFQVVTGVVVLDGIVKLEIARCVERVVLTGKGDLGNHILVCIGRVVIGVDDGVVAGGAYMTLGRAVTIGIIVYEGLAGQRCYLLDYLVGACVNGIRAYLCAQVQMCHIIADGLAAYTLACLQDHCYE